MPNWCENELRVSGDTIQLREFQRIAKGPNGILDMDRFIPYPKRFRDLDREAKKINERFPDDWSKHIKDGFNQGGYKWCINTRGTKWNFSQPMLQSETEYDLRYYFETAWSPPCPVIGAMGKMFPELTFELNYFEGGCAFQGTLVIENGKLRTNETSKYNGTRGG